MEGEAWREKSAHSAGSVESIRGVFVSVRKVEGPEVGSAGVYRSVVDNIECVMGPCGSSTS